MNSILYLEIDEDITSAIEKLTDAEGTRVSIAVPKRSTLFQSAVNLRLLQKAAVDNKKELVLITDDRTAIHLAGGLGIAVAANAKSEAEIPIVGSKPKLGAIEQIIEEEPADNIVGVGEKIQVNEAIDPTQEEEQGKKHKPARIPSYSKLQKRMLLIGIIGVLVLAFFVFTFFFTKATVTLYAKADPLPNNFNFTVDPSLTSSDYQNAKITGKLLSTNKTLTSTFTATGQKDVGTKAHGSVTIKNCDDTNTHTLNAGSIVTSQSKNFSTDTTITIPAGTFGSGLVCTTSTVSVNVTAGQNGDSYNLAAAQYTSPTLNSHYKINGSQMSGGTTKNITVVSQSDIDKTKTTLLDQNKDQVQKELNDKIDSNYQTILESFNPNPTETTSTPALDNEASTATLTLKITYTELAVAKNDFNQMANFQAKKQIDTQSQVYDSGAGNAKITAGNKVGNNGQSFKFVATAYSGIKIDTEGLKNKIKGKKYGDGADIAANTPGVQKADIALWPFWTTGITRITKNIIIDIKAIGS